MAKDADSGPGSRGGDRGGLRAYNERLILSVIRQRGALSKAELARVTGLSAQGVSMIVNALLKEKLVRKKSKVRGQVGQPYTPIALHPRGSFSAGIKIGRRNLETVLLDFSGSVIAHARRDYDRPYRKEVMPAARQALSQTLDVLDPRERERTIGLGIAMPGDLQDWAAELGLSPGALEDWRDADVAGELEEAVGLPAFRYNDATAACAAEMHFGDSITVASAAYFFVGGFIGGGVVLDGRLHTGSRGNAGALGSMPMDGGGRAGRPDQLIHRASLIFLQNQLAAEGLDAGALISGAADDDRAERIFQQWCDQASDAIARAVACSASVIDFEEAVIDGVMRRDWQRRLVEGTRQALTTFNLAGLSPIVIEAGTIGEQAPALGAALLPMTLKFTPHAELLVKCAGPPGAETWAAGPQDNRLAPSTA